MQRAHQVLPVLLDPLAFEALRAMSAGKAPQADWARRDRGIQGRRARQVLLPPLQVQQVIRDLWVQLGPREALVLTDFLSQGHKVSRE